MKSGSPSRTTAAHTKHKIKPRPGPLSSSNVVTPPFIPSEAPPWDSRPVSGAGVVHYHSLHRPRSVPTALGPAPLVTEGEKDKDEDFEKVKFFFFLCSQVVLKEMSFQLLLED